MRHSRISPRLFLERLGQLHLVGACFRVDSQTNGVAFIAWNTVNRRAYSCLRAVHTAAATRTLPRSSTSARCDFHAANANVSLRQEARHSPAYPQAVWLVATHADGIESPADDRPGPVPEAPADSTSALEQTMLQAQTIEKAAQQRALNLDGRECGSQWLSELVPEVEEVSRVLGRRPGLCVIHVGDRSDSHLYVSKKEETCKQEVLHATIDEACADDAVDGVLIQLPLPPHLNEYDVMERLNPRKDVDGFHPVNMGRMLARNAPPRFVPATALGCMQLLQRYNISVTKKHVVVVGDSNIVGTPLSVLLRDAGAGTVTVCHRIAYNNIFDDRFMHTQRRQLRPHAHACLPRLPGPYAATATAAEEGSSTAQARRHLSDDEQCDAPRRVCSPPDAARVSVIQKADTTEVVVEASNRPGLLNALTSVFCDLDLSVTHADVQTHEEGRRVRDIFELTDRNGAPIRDARTLRRLSALVRERVGGVIAAEPGTWDDGHLAALTRTADVLVVAVGFPELVKGEWIKPGAVVLDVGINVVPSPADSTPELVQKNANVSDAERSHVTNSAAHRKDELSKSGDVRVVGDVAFREVARLASAVTPVPGGVGPMTIAALVHNVVLAARYRAGLEQW